MNSNTGEIRDLKRISNVEIASGEWVEVDQKDLAEVSGMNRKQRREWARRHGKPVLPSRNVPYRHDPSAHLDGKNARDRAKAQAEVEVLANTKLP